MSRITMTARALTLAAAGLLLLAAGHPSAPRLFVSNETGNTVSVVDLTTNTVTATVEAGRRPRGIGASPDGRSLYVALGDEDAIGVIDVGTLKVTRKIPAGSDPEKFAVA